MGGRCEAPLLKHSELAQHGLLSALVGTVVQIKKMEADVKNLKDNPQTTLLEGLHSVAYHGGLGRPLICPEGCLSSLNADVLAEFYATNYTAPRMVLAAGGAGRRVAFDILLGGGSLPRVDLALMRGCCRCWML